MAVQLLAEGRLLLGRTYALGIILLPNAKHLVGGLLQCGTVSLGRPEIDALLLLGCAQGLPIALVQDVREGLGIGKLLLLSKVCRRDARAVTAKSSRHDGVAGLARHRLLVLLVQHARSTLQHLLDVGRLKLVDLVSADLLGVYSASASRRKTCGLLVKRLRGGLRTGNVLLSRLLEGLTSLQALTVQASSSLIVGLRASEALADVLLRLLLEGLASLKALAI